jgi:GNAT superfamily N-acetyltransferase
VDLVRARSEPSDPAGCRQRLEPARDEQIDAVYRDSHALWGAGLRLGDYRALWDDLSHTPWGRRWAEFLVWTSGEARVLSSLKVYRPLLRLGRRVERATVAGAVFTPPARRGHGHATAMLRAVIERARERGDQAVLLFSDIGTTYYAGLGFTALPAEEQYGRLSGSLAALRPEVALRPAAEADMQAVREAHDAFCSGRPIAFLRDAEQWEFLRARTKAFFTRLGDPLVRSRFDVAEDGETFVGYVVSVEGRGEWSVREVGARDGDLPAMAAVLRAAARAAARRGLATFYGWLPPDLVEHLAPLRVRRRPRTRAVPMILPFADRPPLARLRSPQAAYIPFQDQF